MNPLFFFKMLITINPKIQRTYYALEVSTQIRDKLKDLEKEKEKFDEIFWYMGDFIASGWIEGIKEALEKEELDKRDRQNYCQTCGEKLK